MQGTDDCCQLREVSVRDWGKKEVPTGAEFSVEKQDLGSELSHCGREERCSTMGTRVTVFQHGRENIGHLGKRTLVATAWPHCGCLFFFAGWFPPCSSL